MLDTYRYKVDFGKVENYIEIHEVLKRDLDFPDYYGGDLDALWDCLTDMLSDISIIEIYNSEAISKKYHEEWQEIIEIFEKTKHAYNDKYSDRFFVTIVNQNGTREEIK